MAPIDSALCKGDLCLATAGILQLRSTKTPGDRSRSRSREDEHVKARQAQNEEEERHLSRKRRMEEEFRIKSAMVGTWTYGTSSFHLGLTAEGVLHFRPDAQQAKKTKANLSWPLQQFGKWQGCDLVVADGSCHGSVQFRLDPKGTSMIVRCRPSREGEFHFVRKAHRVVARLSL